MSLETNLSLAKMAVDFTKKSLFLGSSNKANEQHVALVTPLCVAGNKISFKTGLGLKPQKDIESADGKRYDMWDYQVEVAIHALRKGCGNCGEHAAVAYLWLLKNHARPLDFMSRTNADHAFVVIGRPASATISRPESWGPEAVVCDAWDGAYYPATEIADKMPRGIMESLTGNLPIAPEGASRAE